MDAETIIDELEKLGVLVKAAFTKAKGNTSSLDWEKFLTSDEFGKIQKEVLTFLKSLKASDIQDSLKQIYAKQTALLNGKKISALPKDKLRQYSQLVDAENILVSQELAQAKASSEFLSWLVNDALPVLMKITPVFAALLL